MRAFRFVNTTGGTVPAGAAMTPTGKNTDGLTTVAQPTADSSMRVIFNAPVDVPNNGVGVAFGWDGGCVPVAVLAADEPYTSADTFGTKSGDWRLRKGFKGFRLPTPSIQGIANAVPDPAGDVGTPANWSASVAGILTTADQTGAGRKKTSRGTDNSRGAWWTQETEAVNDNFNGYIPYSADYTTVAGMTTPAAEVGGVQIQLWPITTPFGATPVFADQIATKIAATHRSGRATALWFLEGVTTSKKYLVLGAEGVSSGSTHFALFRGGALVEGQDRTVGGLVFTGGLITGGTLSVPAANVTGLAAVATTGDYASITGTKPPATTTVAASYDSGTKDLTVTVNGVSAVVNLT